MMFIEFCERTLNKTIEAGGPFLIALVYNDNYLHLSNKFELEIETDTHTQKYTIEFKISE